ncbi:P-loop containing nucleoside triphosphate hydrolase protein [Auriculariales sp. MPI-PUGE-AT-0066]|nr:P-loop containing nucleoside triphosphate hydrolase protein [Auriculariales sp. MPI-PUGE-AT-0066]
MKITSKKRRQLDGYINKKLKKEERLELFEKLATTQAQISDSARLHTSSLLGTGISRTHEDKAAIRESSDIKKALSKESSIVVSASALKRHADGSVVQPIILTRKKKLKPVSRHLRVVPAHIAVADPNQGRGASSDEGPQEDMEEDSVMDETASESGSLDESTTNDSPSEASEIEAPPVKTKALGFKNWAMQQLQAAQQTQRSAENVETARSQPTPPIPSPPNNNEPPRKRRKLLHEKPGITGPLGKFIELPKTALAEAVTARGMRLQHVEVTRRPEIQETRLQLPVVSEEQPIMEAILLNSVTVICGETGSGKTTQIPQFLYEAGFGSHSDNPGMIGITQPRRVAAMSMAARVADELSLSTDEVSYQIRYDATVSPSTCIKFMTDGVLLREMATDFLLSKYSVVIVDEAHERSINTDILIGALSRVVRLREDMWQKKTKNIKPLRLVIMSATLRVSDFTENRILFPSPPPVIHVGARQHPVTIHFSRRTTADYQNHTKLPPGGILVFLTGQNEITSVCKKLDAKYGQKALGTTNTHHSFATDTVYAPTAYGHRAEELELGIEDSNNLEDEDGTFSDSDDDLDMGEPDTLSQLANIPMHVVPLYSLLSADKQMKAFAPPPEGTRLVVVATNVAETSITIPGIRYVIDCGRAKQRCYEPASGIQSFRVSWISKASAAQRAGRAGRTGPGHCYRLYSGTLFEDHFDKFAQPEILRMPIEGVVLQMKSMNVDAVVNFPFPTPPDRSALKQAEVLLQHLGALKPVSTTNTSRLLAGPTITDIGKSMSMFPVSPRLSKMLVTGRQHGCLPYVIVLVAALTVGDPFLRDDAQEEVDSEDDVQSSHMELSVLHSAVQREKELRKARRKAYYVSQEMHARLGNGQSDFFRLLSVVGAFEFAGGGHKFCAENFVRLKTMEEIHKLRSQLTTLVRSNFLDSDVRQDVRLKPPNQMQLKVLRQLMTSAFIDQVAVRKDIVQVSAGTKFSTSRNVPYRALNQSEDVFVHPTSVLAGASPPDFVQYESIVRTSKPFMKGLTVLHPAWLPTLGPSFCTFSKPLQGSGPFKELGDDEEVVIPKFGLWQLPAVKRKKGQ